MDIYKIRQYNVEQTMTKSNNIRIDKTNFSVSSLLDDSNDKLYWLSKTPKERLTATELLRQIKYGYDPTTARLQRILEVADLTRR